MGEHVAIRPEMIAESAHACLKLALEHAERAALPSAPDFLQAVQSAVPGLTRAEVHAGFACALERLRGLDPVLA